MPIMGGQQIPQTEQPIVDPSTGKGTRPWLTWFQLIQQLIGSMPLTLPTGTVLGRGSAASGPAVALTLAPSLVVAGTTLHATGATSQAPSVALSVPANYSLVVAHKFAPTGTVTLGAGAVLRIL